METSLGGLASVSQPQKRLFMYDVDYDIFMTPKICPMNIKKLQRSKKIWETNNLKKSLLATLPPLHLLIRKRKAII